jgi:hypothetical protein
MDQYYEALMTSINNQIQNQAASDVNFYSTILDYLKFEQKNLRDIPNLLQVIAAIRIKLENEKPFFTFYSAEASLKKQRILESIKNF